MMKKQQNSIAAFTLIEVMLTIAVLSIIVAVAIPNYADFTRKQNISISSKVLNKAFTTARVEAITSDQSSAVVCWNLGGAVIDFPGGVAGTQVIAPGSIAVARGTLAGITTIESSNQILTSQQSLTITDNDNDDCVTFDAQGRLGNSNVSPLGFLICREAGDAIDSLRVEVANSGRSLVKLNTNTTGLGIQACP